MVIPHPDAESPFLDFIYKIFLWLITHFLKAGDRGSKPAMTLNNDRKNPKPN